MNGSLLTSLARETDTLMTTQIPFAYSLKFIAGAFKTIFISDPHRCLKEHIQSHSSIDLRLEYSTEDRLFSLNIFFSAYLFRFVAPFALSEFQT